jgi:hypothetical protein
MIDKNLDVQAISAILLGMNARTKTIISIFPKDKKYEFLLRNLASAAIHLGLFARDLNNYCEGNEPVKPYNDEEKFFNECGCKEHKD